ncbi:hypothetical protein DFH09DRAFT_1073782 [Mycena vulgaris]|nr:hypothetical protein DFH09DRAFT_1073782 [Mycena vulgaris]
MSSCTHALNSVISGIGVRISYYLQALFLGCLSVRSGSVDEITGALYTLMATNTAMAVTGLILGLTVIIIYLLSLGWITVIASLASCYRLSDETKIIHVVSVIQGYVVLSFGFAVLATASSFGENSECNHEAIAVVFRQFSALRHGHIFGCCIVCLMFIGYTAMTVWDYTAPLRGGEEKQQSQEGESSAQPQVSDYGVASALIDYDLLAMLLFILIIWVFFVLNTELVIHWYQPTSNDSVPKWEFGQILPMFLTLLPLIQMISTFNQFGIKPKKRVDKTAKLSVINDNEYDAREKSLLRGLLARKMV